MGEQSLQAFCEAFLDEAMLYNDLPGLVIGVTCGDETFVGARGVRDVTTGDPLQPDDVFHCASVSKLFTSAAILKLIEAGVLSLDDRLCDILPDCFVDPRWREVRLYQMLSHTAGIGDVTDYHWEQALTGEDALSDYVCSPEVTDPPLLWAPGEGGFRYSNIAYEILGHIVSVKSGEFLKAIGEDTDTGSKPAVRCKPAAQARPAMSYEGFVQRFLMEPASMTDSTMKTFERLGVSAGDDCPLITEEIRRRNAAASDGCETASFGGPEAAASSRPEAAASSKPKTAVSDGCGCHVPWHPMALPHEKAQDRSIVPVTHYPYTRSHAPSSTLTSPAADLLCWARAHMDGFAAAEAIERASNDQTLGTVVCSVASDATPPAADSALLSPGTYQHIRHEYAEVPNNREKMGLGWFMRRQGGYQLYGHEGTDDGFRASLWICPERKLGIAVLSNLSGAPVKKLSKKLFDRITEGIASSTKGTAGSVNPIDKQPPQR